MRGPPLRIRTVRLDLRLCAAQDLERLLDGRPSRGLAFAAGYPTEGTLLAAALQQRLTRLGLRTDPFGLFQVVRRADAVVVGDVAFVRPPDRRGEAAVAFGVAPGARRRGYAAEALRGLAAWAAQRPEVTALRAEAELLDDRGREIARGAGLSERSAPRPR